MVKGGEGGRGGPMDDMWVNLYNRPNRFRPSELFRATSGALFLSECERVEKHEANRIGTTFGSYSGGTQAEHTRPNPSVPLHCHGYQEHAALGEVRVADRCQGGQNRSMHCNRLMKRAKRTSLRWKMQPWVILSLPYNGYGCVARRYCVSD